jgi:glycosyltransferase involved in cell wall biosynthesis
MSLRLLTLVNLLARSGGTTRALQSLDYYYRIGWRLTTFIDYLTYIWSVREGFEDVIAIYKRYNIIPVGYERPVSLIHLLNISPKSRRWLYSVIGELLYKYNLRRKVFLTRGYKPGVIISFHENLPYLHLASELKNLYSAPTITFLQLPPFYGDKTRIQNIKEACLLHRRLLANTWSEKALDAILGLLEVENFKENIREIEGLLNSLDMVIAVTKAIAIEMQRVPRNLVYMDPGYSLDDNAVDIIRRARALNIPREDYIAFIGRPMDCRKGFTEALIAFKYLLKEFPSLKLLVAGTTSPSFKRRAYRFLEKHLGVDKSKVIFTGLLSREDLYKLIRRSRLILYPSHVDSYSLAVLESLMLEIPVIAYRIPALDMYYGNIECKGIWLVKEGCIDAFVGAAVKVLELERKRDLKMESPRIRSMDDIMRDEVELINSVLR